MNRVALPPSPEGVRIVLRDGSEHPAELVYQGPDAKGCHMWFVTAVFPLRDIAFITADVLPPHTGFSFGVRR